MSDARPAAIERLDFSYPPVEQLSNLVFRQLNQAAA